MKIRSLPVAQRPAVASVSRPLTPKQAGRLELAAARLDVFEAGPPRGPDCTHAGSQAPAPATTPAPDLFGGLATVDRSALLGQYAHSASARAGLSSADSGSGAPAPSGSGASAPAAGSGATTEATSTSTSTSTDTTDSSGGQNISQTETSDNADGTRDTSTQTHRSDGKGNSVETQTVEHTDKSGNVTGEHVEEQQSADGSSQPLRPQYRGKATSTMPSPDAEERGKLDPAEAQAVIGRKRAGVTDPPDENGVAGGMSVERLSRGKAAAAMTKVNPNPEAGDREPLTGPGKTIGPIGGDPHDELHQHKAAPVRPVRPDVPKGLGPKGPRGP